jgi:hypothetical protein
MSDAKTPEEFPLNVFGKNAMAKNPRSGRIGISQTNWSIRFSIVRAKVKLKVKTEI